MMLSAQQRQLRGLALLICTLSLLIVAVSAYLRLDAAGLGCFDWPACYGNVLTADPRPMQYGFARVLHRIAASSALVLTLVLVWGCRRAQCGQAVRAALMLLAIMVALAVLGFFSTDPRRAWVGFLNIVGGLALVSFSWRVFVATGDSCTRAARPDSILLRIGLLAVSLALAAGAWIGASYAAAACADLPLCAISSKVGTGELAGALNPFQYSDSVAAPGDVSAVILHLLHRGLALLALLLLAVFALRDRRSNAWRLAAALLLTAVIGVISVAMGLPLWGVVAHGIAAALTLMAAVSIRC